MRESPPWVSLFSPFPFHSVYSVEDHRKHVDWIKTVNPEAVVVVKVSTPIDIDMVAVGSYHAGANILQIDGSYGGTGAALTRAISRSCQIPSQLRRTLRIAIGITEDSHPSDVELSANLHLIIRLRSLAPTESFLLRQLIRCRVSALHLGSGLRHPAQNRASIWHCVR